MIVTKCEGESAEIDIGIDEYVKLITECRDSLKGVK